MSGNLSVIIVEDDAPMRLGCVQAVELAGLKALAVGTAEEAMPLLHRGSPAVVVTDLKLPGLDGMSLVTHCREIDADLPVIVITGHGDIAVAVEAMRSGAYDFITKPFAPDRLVDVVRRAAEKRSLTLEISDLRQRLARSEAIEAKILGRSPQMQRVRELVAEIADTTVDVLIKGETGVGKELVAQQLHRLSRRRTGNFVAINCGAISEEMLDSELFGHEAGVYAKAEKRRIGKLEYANRGTLFLDELESMRMSVQLKLLRFLQDRTIERLGSNQKVAVDCRVIAAAKGDLSGDVRSGTFRSDLYYRLNVGTISIPPLRERREDIPLLLEYFTLLSASQFGRPQPKIPAEQMQRLMAYSWPGNIRELRNVADCLVLGIPKEGLDGLDVSADAPAHSLTEWVNDFERSLIENELRRCGGNLSQAASSLKVPKTTLHDKIRKYGLLIRQQN